MSSNTTSSAANTGLAGPEQLSLLTPSSVSARFQLSASTRTRGLRHVAEIRQMLADRNSSRPARTQRAA
jgi:hypothetical protein